MVCLDIGERSKNGKRVQKIYIYHLVAVQSSFYYCISFCIILLAHYVWPVLLLNPFVLRYVLLFLWSLKFCLWHKLALGIHLWVWPLLSCLMMMLIIVYIRRKVCNFRPFEFVSKYKLSTKKNRKMVSVPTMKIMELEKKYWIFFHGDGS